MGRRGRIWVVEMPQIELMNHFCRRIFCLLEKP